MGNPTRRASISTISSIARVRQYVRAHLTFDEKCSVWCCKKVKNLGKRCFVHLTLVFTLIFYTVVGALVFKAIEQTGDNLVGDQHRRDKEELIRKLSVLTTEMNSSKNTEEWMKEATPKMLTFLKTVIDTNENVLFPNRTALWTWLDALYFAATIYTTLGYGNITAKTNAGRIAVFVYAIFGIPLFVIILTATGQAFAVRTQQMVSCCRQICCDSVMWLKIRQCCKNCCENIFLKSAEEPEVANDPNPPQPFYATRLASSHTAFEKFRSISSETAYSVSDLVVKSSEKSKSEFDLPVWLVLLMLTAYTLIGTIPHIYIENWTFAEAFYFVFVSMSTIGFGDYVPKNQYFVIPSMIFLIVGYGLTSMCIQVISFQMSKNFSQATVKMGKNMGIDHVEEDAQSVYSLYFNSVPPRPSTYTPHRVGSHEVSVLDHKKN